MNILSAPGGHIHVPHVAASQFHACAVASPSMRGATPLDVAAASVMDNNELALALTESDLQKVISPSPVGAEADRSHLVSLASVSCTDQQD